jgi:hypothetical protein
MPQSDTARNEWSRLRNLKFAAQPNGAASDFAMIGTEFESSADEMVQNT